MEISRIRILEYRFSLLEALKDMGATKVELDLITDELIINAISRNRNINDVAWGLLQ